jgi:hypothetical protein
MKRRIIELIGIGIIVCGFLFGRYYGPELSPMQMGGLGLFAGVGICWILLSLGWRYLKF